MCLSVFFYVFSCSVRYAARIVFGGSMCLFFVKSRGVNRITTRPAAWLPDNSRRDIWRVARSWLGGYTLGSSRLES